MNDPRVPDERGLRATVRRASGINTGDASDEMSVLPVIRRRIGDVLHRFEGRFGDRLAVLDPLADRALVRPASIGAGVGLALVVGAFLAIAGHAALRTPETVATAEVEVTESILRVEEAAAKVDRLPTSGKLAAIATALVPETTHDDLTITTRGPSGDTTLAMPALAFAAADLRGNTGVDAIDRLIDVPPIAAAPAIGGAEEGDDDRVVPLVLPMPRARPAEVVEALPLPRPRPRILASLTPPGVSVAPPGVSVGNRQEDAPTPDPRSSGGALGFFSTPAEPVKPPGRIKIDTPFGVPYVLQTGSVETACLKPELVDLLRRIESRYGQKVVITSGFRDRGRQGSLHRQCAAADIEVNGVGAVELATFARTIPGIGGVGTYCHPNMIHVDIGTPRDWKYGCGSYFAMRGAPGKWGKVPATLAKAQASGQRTTNGETEED